MSTTKHFTNCNGETVELAPEWTAGNWVATPKGFILTLTLDGVDSVNVAKKVRNANLFAIGKCPACGHKHFAERVIERPAKASNHKCDGRCVNATGRKCECSCKGKNHGNA